MEDAPPQEVESIEGVLERITYHAPDSGWTIARVTVPSSATSVAAVGAMLSPEVGESVRLYGQWQTHPRYGPQFRFDRYQLVRPGSAVAIQAYLGGGLVEGVGPKLAATLVAHFGDRTLDVLEHEPERLTEVAGIGGKRARALREAWARHHSIHQVMVFLHEHGAGGALAARIHAAYQDQAIEVMEREPYRLAREVRGVGFLTADRIASSVGIATDDPARVDAGLLHALGVGTDEGHVYLPREMLIERARALLDVPEQVAEMGVERLWSAGKLCVEAHGDEVAVYDHRLYSTEAEVARRIGRLAAGPVVGVPAAQQVAALLSARGALGEMELSAEQIEAVTGALQSGVSVITGGPGTGKTTVTRALVGACRVLGRSVALASPTGRAAKRLAQVSGHEASTLHRLLAYDPYRRGFRYGVDEQLPVAMVVVDEASMVDITLARDVLRAIREGGQVVFVGDADQLPSIGPGLFMRDLVRSGAGAVYRLNTIYRQAAGSDIVQSAHRLNRGEAPGFPTHQEWLQERGDCVLFEDDEPEAVADRVVRTVVQSLPRLGYGAGDVQVITPVRRGPIGVESLNARLQAELNPEDSARPQLSRGDVVFRTGDRVLQVVNDYDKGVFNGDIGVVGSVQTADRCLTVQFEVGAVEYGPAELDELDLAYALTVHKAQGSEYPAVVLVIHSSHYVMLQRNLLYTALTRAQRMACVVGNQRGLWRAIKNTSGHERFSRLAERLSGELPNRP